MEGLCPPPISLKIFLSKLKKSLEIGIPYIEDLNNKKKNSENQEEKKS